MNYLKPKFQGPNPRTLDGCVCEACVYGERWAPKHDPKCPKMDIHRVNAAKALGIKPEEVTEEQRRDAKAVSFGLQFGRPALAPGQSLEEFCDLYGKFA